MKYFSGYIQGISNTPCKQQTTLDTFIQVSIMTSFNQENLLEKIAEQNEIIKNYATQIETLQMKNYSLQQENKQTLDELRAKEFDMTEMKDDLDEALDMVSVYERQTLPDFVPDMETNDENIEEDSPNKR